MKTGLEYSIAESLKKIENITDIKVNSSGWGEEKSSDLIVKYNSGLEFFGFQKENTLIIQIQTKNRSFNDEIYNIAHTIKKFKVSAGIIISKTKLTKKESQYLENFKNTIDVPILVFTDKEFNKLLLRK